MRFDRPCGRPCFLTVDEQLVPFRGRCSFIQYMPSKPDKYGIKVFWICEASTSYPLKGIPYLGKGTTFTREATNDSVGCDIVKNLSEQYADSGRNVTCDNFFTDLKLAEELLKKKLSIVGTVRRNKKFLPPSFQMKKDLPLMESKFLFREGISLVSFQGKRNKNTILLSTMHSDTAVDEESGKPEIVLTYNKTKGGVDSLDQMAHSFSVKRKTKRWPLVIVFNMIDLAGVAARVVWSQAFPTDRYAHQDNRQQFLIQVAKELVLEQVKRRAAQTKTMNLPYRLNMEAVLKSLSASCDQGSISAKRQAMSTAGKQTPSKSSTPSKSPASQKSAKRKRSPSPPAATPRKRCSFCPTKKDRKTKMQCAKCTRYICGEHSSIICTDCNPN